MFEYNTVVSEALKDEGYLSVVRDILFNREFLKLKGYSHHANITRYEHSINVSYLGYKFAKKVGANAVELARAGLFHDMFFYELEDYENKSHNYFKSHAYTHGKVALENARKIFALSRREEEMIETHMWPLTIIPPKYIESYIIGIVDKYSTIYELYLSRKRQNDIISIRN